MTGRVVTLRNRALPDAESIPHRRPADARYVIGRRDGAEQLGLADTQLALLQLRLEMSRHVADQGDMAHHQHQGQQHHPNGSRFAHAVILKQFMARGVDAPESWLNMNRKCSSKWL